MNMITRKRSTAITIFFAVLLSLCAIILPDKVYAEPDSTPPVIHSGTLQVILPEGKTTANSGDRVEISVEITEDSSNVTQAQCYFTEPVSGKLKFFLLAG